MTRNAMIGGTIWTALAGAVLGGWVHLTVIELLFLLAPLVVVPLGLELVTRTLRASQFQFFLRIAGWVQLPAALCVTLSFWISPGTKAEALVVPWLCLACLGGIIALKSLIRGGYRQFSLACVAASFLYWLVGCAWLIASRLGLMPMGFQEPIVLLTAVHFHFAGFAAPLLAMAVGGDTRERGPLAQSLFTAVAAGVLAGPGLLAAGFVIGPRVKLAMALLVACSEAGLSLYFLAGVPKLRPHLAQVFVGLSAISVLLAMVLAALWAIGEFPLQPFVHLNEMAKFHGTANALGFILCGLIGWTLAKRTAFAPGADQE
jgi:YndJ-like protein